MPDISDSAVLENPQSKVESSKDHQRPSEFVTPTEEQRRRELEEISGKVNGPVEFISQNGNRIDFNQQTTNADHPNSDNHRTNVSLLKNAFHKGVWYDSSGIARPRKK